MCLSSCWNGASWSYCPEMYVQASQKASSCSSTSFVGVLIYDLTLLRYSVWSIFVLAYPMILMSFGRNLFRYCKALVCVSEGRKGDVTRPKSAGKVFFFARSPEAPRTMMTVFSLSSLLLRMMVLAIERALGFLLQIMTGSGKLRG